jgi:hypothetical protein
MTLPHAFASFFAGLLLANAVPHFVHGCSGDRFPTPFANPPGKGLSSPTLNVLWSLLNLAAGGILLRSARITGLAACGLCFAGVAAVSLFSSVRFASKSPAIPGQTNVK